MDRSLVVRLVALALALGAPHSEARGPKKGRQFGLELELTEGSLMKDTDDIQQCLRKLKNIGVRLAIDDFGTGYSCLSYLKQFPIDVLKIDRTFVNDIGVSEDGQAICGVILSIAKRLGLESVAEGIENERQLEFLVAQGCEYAQGFYFGRPMKPEDLRRLALTDVAHGPPKLAIAAGEGK